MIEEARAVAQAIRLDGLPGYPKSDAAQMEIVKALQTASDPQHAGRIVSDWLRTNTFAPTPKDIYDLAVKHDHEFDPREWRCSVCESTGWAPVYEHIVWSGSKREDPVRISRERYEDLREKCSGRVGQDLVQTAVISCTHCKLGRDRALAEQMEAMEERR